MARVSRQGELFGALAPLEAPPDLAAAYDLPAPPPVAERQLLLAVAVGGAETVAPDLADPMTPPATRGRAVAPPGHDSAAIPAKCPVVGKPVCYFADCRHWTADRCAHPEANRPRRRRRRR